MKGQIVISQCLLCGAPLSKEQIFCRDLITNVEGRFVYILCSICGSYLQNPIPSVEYLTECYLTQNLGYKKPTFHTDDHPTAKHITNLLEGILLVILRNISSRIDTIELKPTLPPPAKILEIGCSHGARLSDLKKHGYEVKGIDLSQESVDFAKKRGLDVECVSIETCSFPENSFDIVIMSMVLEHIREPINIISQISKWIKPGGELLISIPCADGFEFKMYKEYCYVVQPPYHIFIPTIKGLQFFLEPFFTIKYIAPQAFHRDLIASAEFKRKCVSDTSIRDNILHIINKSDTLKSAIRMILLIYIHFGGVTSRVSLRCIKKHGVD